MNTPSVGRIVHYVSYGSPVRPDGTQEFVSQCRAAIITDVCPDDDPEANDCASLCVLNPTGQFFTHHCAHDEADEPAGGTWHWPERV